MTKKANPSYNLPAFRRSRLLRLLPGNSRVHWQIGQRLRLVLFNSDLAVFIDLKVIDIAELGAHAFSFRFWYSSSRQSAMELATAASLTLSLSAISAVSHLSHQK